MKREYIDLQVNGFAGVDFSTLELDYDSFMKAAEKVFSTGTVVFLPTIVTSDVPLYERNISIIKNAVEKNGLEKAVPGVHLEGPFISRLPGAVGCHNPDFVRDCDCKWLLELLERTGNYVKMMTVAAELGGVTDLIKCAVSKGITVSLGHHLATAEDIRKCAAAGAKTLTHLGNGCPNMMNRHDNPVWAGLGCDDLTAMLITDGHHLPGDIVKCMARIKGVDKIIVTSDAAPVAGLPPGRYHMLNNDAILEENGKFHNPEKGCLVGSSASVADCVRFLESLDIFTEEEIYKVSYLNAAKLIGIA